MKSAMIMLKRFILLFSLMIFAGMIAGCGNPGRLSLPDNIDRITIYREGTSQTTFSYTDPEKVKSIIDFFHSLQLTSTTDPNNAEQLYSNVWQIKAYVGNDTYGINIMANNYIQSPDGKWWKSSSDQLTAFETLLKEQVPDELPGNLLFDEWRE